MKTRNCNIDWEAVSIWSFIIGAIGWIAFLAYKIYLLRLWLAAFKLTY